MAVPVVRRRRDGLMEIARAGKPRRLGRGVAMAAVAVPIVLALLAALTVTLPVVLLALPAGVLCAVLVGIASLRRLPRRRAGHVAAPASVHRLRSR